MKLIMLIIEMAFSIVMTFLFCVYVGYKLEQVVISIFVGFFLSMAYLGYAVYKNIK